MEDRYEINGKIGAGGLGAVYRGFDTKMKRQVAIKRILTNPDDPSIQDDATKQLVAEAGALASLQHPHIVTVYDVGQDENGPYVIMELIEGKTLDEIIEEHPLTWDDFRELAMQSQEALIAAQELNMIHSDLKPPNIMLNWLPSGKFQLKIVDFGLAMLAQHQSKEELETIDTVFGSIFFMPPEQFEREVLDARSDLYSMGCVYYQCLTGKYPFMGADAEEVMNAHLNHIITPIQHIRKDVPIWVCDWVMWMINRNREDRPQCAREALAVFIQNNRQPNPEMSTGRPPSKGPKLILPGQATGDPNAPQPIEGRPIKPPGDMETVEMMAAYEEPEPEPEPEPEAQPEALKIVRVRPTAPLTMAGLGSATQPLTQTTSSHPTAMAAAEDTQITPVAKPLMPAKPPMSAAAKVVIAAALGIAILIVGITFLNKRKQNQTNARLGELMRLASVEGTTEVPMNRDDLSIILNTVGYSGAIDPEERDNYYALLTLAKAPDGVNFDIAILNFAKEQGVLGEVRSNLIGRVLRDRNNVDMLTLLIDYGLETTDKAAAVASFRAAHMMGNQVHVDRYLAVIEDSGKPTLRPEAERSLGRIIDDSMNRDTISIKVATAYDRTGDANVRFALIRLLGRCSTDIALQKISKGLESEDPRTRTASTVALGDWKDLRAIQVLLDYLSGVTDAKLRQKAFEAMIKVGKQEFVLKDQVVANDQWVNIAKQATTGKEKLMVINALAIIPETWQLPLVQGFGADPNGQVKERALKAVAHIMEQDALRKKTQGGE